MPNRRRPALGRTSPRTASRDTPRGLGRPSVGRLCAPHRGDRTGSAGPARRPERRASAYGTSRGDAPRHGVRNPCASPSCCCSTVGGGRRAVEEIGRDDGLELIARAVQHSLVGTNCRTWAILEPSAARGLRKAADFHERRVNAILDEMVRRASGLDSAPPRVEGTRAAGPHTHIPREGRSWEMAQGPGSRRPPAGGRRPTGTLDGVPRARLPVGAERCDALADLLGRRDAVGAVPVRRRVL